MYQFVCAFPRLQIAPSLLDKVSTDGSHSIFHRFLLFPFLLLQIPAFPIPAFTDSCFSHSCFYRFRLFPFLLLQIPAFPIPAFTDSGFSHSCFYRFRLFPFLLFLFPIPFPIPFPDSPFLVLQIAVLLVSM